jgi:OmpA-OmpF porin, OOP family
MVAARVVPRLLLLAILLTAGGTAAAQPATASGFALDRFDPAPTGGRWFALDSVDVHGPLGIAAGLVFDSAVRPLVIYRGGERRTSVVGQQHVLHLGAAAVLLRHLRLALEVPLGVYAGGRTGDLNGQSVPGPSGRVAGDVRIDADVRLLGRAGGPVRVAMGVALFAPSGTRAAYSSDGKVRVEPRLLAAGDAGRFSWATRLGFEYRGLETDLGGRALGSEVHFGAAAGVRVVRGLFVGPELYGSAVVTNGGPSKGTTPIEALLGARYCFARGFQLGLAGGGGLTRGLGSPQARGLLSFAWSMDSKGTRAPGDRDGDGLPDGEDACPDEPGPRTADPKTNGCPPPDLGELPVEVQRTRCVDFPNAPGCPSADRDGDGIPDAFDACPDKPGPRTGNPATNGCPIRAPH